MNTFYGVLATLAMILAVLVLPTDSDAEHAGYRTGRAMFFLLFSCYFMLRKIDCMGDA